MKRKTQRKFKGFQDSDTTEGSRQRCIFPGCMTRKEDEHLTRCIRLGLPSSSPDLKEKKENEERAPLQNGLEPHDRWLEGTKLGRKTKESETKEWFKVYCKGVGWLHPKRTAPTIAFHHLLHRVDSIATTTNTTTITSPSVIQRAFSGEQWRGKYPEKFRYEQPAPAHQRVRCGLHSLVPLPHG